MKLNNSKILIVVLVCVIALVGVYMYYNYRKASTQNNFPETATATTPNPISENKVVTTSKSEYSTDILPASLQGMGVTDIFYGSFSSSKVNEDSANPEPGQRFKVSITKNHNYINIGNAKGVVVVNDLSGKHAKIAGSPLLYRFYTKYDPKNNWYTIIKIIDPPFEPDV